MRHARSCSHRQPRLCSSVAVPLGINGPRAREGKGLELPYQQPAASTLFQFDFTVGRPGGTATLDAERRIAGRPRGGGRPARPKGSQEQHLVHRPKLSGSACRPLSRGAPRLGDKAGDPKGSQEFSPIHRLNFARFAASGDCNELRRVQSAAWGGGELRGSKSRRCSAKCSAQRGGKTAIGFPARRTSTAQFSAPCQPHCGSACAPPHFPRACTIQLFRFTAEMIESLL